MGQQQELQVARLLYTPDRDMPAWLLDLPFLLTFKVGGGEKWGDVSMLQR